VPVAGDPPVVGGHHRIHLAADRVRPAEHLAGLPRGGERLPVIVVGHVARPGVDHQRPAIGQPGEEVGRVPGRLPGRLWPVLLDESQKSWRALSVMGT
jgi:hypothetical protein